MERRQEQLAIRPRGDRLPAEAEGVERGRTLNLRALPEFRYQVRVLLVLGQCSHVPITKSSAERSEDGDPDDRESSSVTSLGTFLTQTVMYRGHREDRAFFHLTVLGEDVISVVSVSG